MTKKKSEEHLEEFKYLIDSSNLTDAEKKADKDALLKVREARFRRRSESEMRLARLMQLKYQIEEYLNQSTRYQSSQFVNFLSTYIDILYSKQKDFAADISVKPIVVSHILNKHREPSDVFLYRLSLHAQDSFEGLGDFKMDAWINVYYRDKVNQMMSTGNKWEEEEGKYVTGKPIDLDD